MTSIITFTYWSKWNHANGRALITVLKSTVSGSLHGSRNKYWLKLDDEQRLVRISSSQDIYLDTTRTKVQEVQHVATRLYVQNAHMTVTWCVDQEFQILFVWWRWRWNDKGGEDSGVSCRDEDPFEKQMRLANESHETQVRPSRSEGQGYLTTQPHVW